MSCVCLGFWLWLLLARQDIKRLDREIFWIAIFSRVFFSTTKENFSAPWPSFVYTLPPNDPFHKRQKKFVALSIESKHTKRSLFFLLSRIVFCLTMDIRRRIYRWYTWEQKGFLCNIKITRYNDTHRCLFPPFFLLSNIQLWEKVSWWSRLFHS